jgi:hypothetical protein
VLRQNVQLARQLFEMGGGGEHGGIEPQVGKTCTFGV